MNNFMNVSIVLVNTIILYIIFYNMQSFTNKNNSKFYGAYIKDSYISKKDLSFLDRKFKLLLSIGFIVTLSVYIISYCFLNSFDLVSTFALFIFILYNFAIYLFINNKIKKLKSTCNNETKNSEIIIDTNFLEKKSALIRKFRILFFLPTSTISIVMCILSILNYDKIPFEIPSNFGFNGIATSFMPKSYFNVIMPYTIILILPFLGINCLKSRLKIDKNNIEKTSIENIKYLNKIGYSFLLLTYILLIFSINISVSYFANYKINPFLISIFCIILVSLSVYLLFIFIKSPNSKLSSYSPDDEDSHWILGSIYNNPNDPLVFVEKRFGLGWTVNVGTPIGKIIFIITMIILLFSLISIITSV